MPKHYQGIMRLVSQSPWIDAGEAEPAMQLVLDNLCQGLQVDRAGIWLFDASRSQIQCRQLLDRTSGFSDEPIVLTEQSFPRYFSALLHDRVIAADDAHTHEATAEFSECYLTPLGINSMLDVPVRHHGELIGIICCEHRGEARQWRSEDVVFAGSMGDLIGRAINAAEMMSFRSQLQQLNAELEQRVAQRNAELETAHRQLVESEKMAALGGLVAGVAHEVNTPLGVAITATSLLTESLQQLQKLFTDGLLDENNFVQSLQEQQRIASLLQSNLERAATLVKSFKKTAVDQSSDIKQEFDLADVLNRTLQNLQPVSKKVCQLTLNCPDRIMLDSYPGSLSQIITNLVMNALHHAFEHQPNNALLTINVLPQAGFVLIQVQDNGQGMTAEIQKKIFDPFFTTKRGAGGSGLGLSIAYNLTVQQLGGKIRVQSAPQQGCLFEIQLPLASTPAATAQA
ncbi:sensor histidine kinase [Rheinheimera sp.]|uniref:sensor histidine kinase n=1 Tax=Rheinheimera sp. TaxID=1869214 RepID=UPI003AF4BC13